jgi:integrase
MPSWSAKHPARQTREGLCGRAQREQSRRAAAPAAAGAELRHSYATHCLAQNMNIEVRRILGHEDSTLISRTYGHLVTADLHRAAMAGLIE